MKIKNEIVRDQYGKVVAHRTWFKVIFNPIFRKLGFSITSQFNEDYSKVIGYKILPYPKYCKIEDE